MELGFRNPFDGYGHIVRGSQFMGRQQSFQAVTSRIVSASEPGNLAIIGDHRIGKSSLAYVSIIERRNELIQRGRLPVWVNVAKYDNSRDFFTALVSLSYSELEDLDLLNEQIKKAKERVTEIDVTWSETFERIQRYFKRVRQSGHWFIFVLDEFDHARILFKDSVSGFQQLRSLSYDDPDGRVTFVTTSRRTIREIEEQTHAISTFDGIFAKEYLGVFDVYDMEKYYLVLRETGIEITELLSAQILFNCGGHPYLLSSLGYRLVADKQAGKDDTVDQLMIKLSPSFLSQYERMIRLLIEDGRLKKLLQTVFGPAIDVLQTDVDDFLRYGLIIVGDDGIYKAFSAHFQGYLRLIERNEELWPIWKQTELAIRKIISKNMSEKYLNKDWIVELELEKPRLKAMFDKCREAQVKEARAFGSRASSNLIDFTYPSDLFEIIFTDWLTFSTILGKDKAHWEARRQFLSRIRNPLAHNRDTVLQEYEKLIAEGYCKEILACIEYAQ